MKTIFHGACEPIKKLRLLQSVFWKYSPCKTTPTIILAGGAVRDDYMGKADEISDFDIFIESWYDGKNINDQDKQMIEIIDQVFPNQTDVTHLFDSAYLSLEEQHDAANDVNPGKNKHISDVWEVMYGDNTYQLILTKLNPIQYVNKYFDLGFCKTYCDGYKIRYTDDFLHDAKHRQLTIVGDDMTSDQIDYTINYHCDKIQWKYGDWTVVVPPRYQKYVPSGTFPTS